MAEITNFEWLNDSDSLTKTILSDENGYYNFQSNPLVLTQSMLDNGLWFKGTLNLADALGLYEGEITDRYSFLWDSNVYVEYTDYVDFFDVTTNRDGVTLRNYIIDNGLDLSSGKYILDYINANYVLIENGELYYYENNDIVKVEVSLDGGQTFGTIWSLSSFNVTWYYSTPNQITETALPGYGGYIIISDLGSTTISESVIITALSASSGLEWDYNGYFEMNAIIGINYTGDPYTQKFKITRASDGASAIISVDLPLTFSNYGVRFTTNPITAYTDINGTTSDYVFINLLDYIEIENGYQIVGVNSVEIDGNQYLGPSWNDEISYIQVVPHWASDPTIRSVSVSLMVKDSSENTTEYTIYGTIHIYEYSTGSSGGDGDDGDSGDTSERVLTFDTLTIDYTDSSSGAYYSAPANIIGNMWFEVSDVPAGLSHYYPTDVEKEQYGGPVFYISDVNALVPGTYTCTVTTQHYEEIDENTSNTWTATGDLTIVINDENNYRLEPQGCTDEYGDGSYWIYKYTCTENDIANMDFYISLPYILYRNGYDEVDSGTTIIRQADYYTNGYVFTAPLAGETWTCNDLYIEVTYNGKTIKSERIDVVVSNNTVDEPTMVKNGWVIQNPYTANISTNHSTSNYAVTVGFEVYDPVTQESFYSDNIFNIPFGETSATVDLSYSEYYYGKEYTITYNGFEITGL